MFLRFSISVGLLIVLLSKVWARILIGNVISMAGKVVALTNVCIVQTLFMHQNSEEEFLKGRVSQTEQNVFFKNKILIKLK